MARSAVRKMLSLTSTVIVPVPPPKSCFRIWIPSPSVVIEPFMKLMLVLVTSPMSPPGCHGQTGLRSFTMSTPFRHESIVLLTASDSSQKITSPNAGALLVHTNVGVAPPSSRTEQQDEADYRECANGDARDCPIPPRQWRSAIEGLFEGGGGLELPVCGMPVHDTVNSSE